MAEAPKGPPRKSTTYKEFSGMNSQDQRYGVEQNEFFYLENIMRVADGKLHSVPGPSAVLSTFPHTDANAHDFLLENSSFFLLETGDHLLLEG